jgi:hypothetical protein
LKDSITSKQVNASQKSILYELVYDSNTLINSKRRINAIFLKISFKSLPDISTDSIPQLDLNDINLIMNQWDKEEVPDTSYVYYSLVEAEVRKDSKISLQFKEIAKPPETEDIRIHTISEQPIARVVHFDGVINSNNIKGNFYWNDLSENQVTYHTISLQLVVPKL